MPWVAATHAAISGSRTPAVRRVGVAREPGAHELGVGRAGDRVLGGQGRDIRRRDPARARAHPRHPIAGVRDDAGGEFGGHPSRLRRRLDMRRRDPRAGFTRAGRGTRRPRRRRRRGTCREGSGENMCACTRALGHALPAQRSASSAGGRRQQDSSGQRRRRARFCVSRPRNHLASSNGTPTVIENSPRPTSCRSASSTRTCPPGCRCTGSTRSCGSCCVERAARAPVLAAHDLALDRAGDVDRQRQAVVLVDAS